MNNPLLEAATRLESAVISDCRVVTGFDGFVDEMVTLVGERRSLTDFTPVPDIAAFGGLISSAAGHSSLREIVVNDMHPGECAVNLADGLASLDARLECFAKLGRHPYFLIDLVDSASRSAPDIIEIAGILRDFDPSGPLTLGLNAADALALGCRASGFFVRNARGAGLRELGEFLRQWASGFDKMPT